VLFEFEIQKILVENRVFENRERNHDRILHAVLFCNASLILGAIHQRRPVERWGGVRAYVDDLGQGGLGSAMTRTSKKDKKIGVSGVRIGVRHTPPSPPRPRASGSQYILRFGRFYARYTVPTFVDGKGEGGVLQTDDAGQGGGGVQKVSLGRL